MTFLHQPLWVRVCLCFFPRSTNPDFPLTLPFPKCHCHFSLHSHFCVLAHETCLCGSNDGAKDIPTLDPVVKVPCIGKEYCIIWHQIGLWNSEQRSLSRILLVSPNCSKCACNREAEEELTQTQENDTEEVRRHFDLTERDWSYTATKEECQGLLGDTRSQMRLGMDSLLQPGEGVCFGWHPDFRFIASRVAREFLLF